MEIPTADVTFLLPAYQSGVRSFRLFSNSLRHLFQQLSL